MLAAPEAVTKVSCGGITERIPRSRAQRKWANETSPPMPDDPVFRLPPSRQPRASARLVEWVPWPFDNPSQLGHATVSFSGWIVHRIPIFRTRDGGFSVGSPSSPEIDAEGRVKTRGDGKRAYAAVLTFEDWNAKERWERAVRAALADAGIARAASHQGRIPRGVGS
jgi:hypothetical protein